MIKISASFDDGSNYDVRVADLMSKHEIDTTFFIPVNWKKYNARRGVGFISEEELENIASKFEIGSHGVEHHLLTRVGDSEQNIEIIDSFKYWRSQRIRVSAFCYPRGYYTTEIKDKVRDAGYKWARTVRIGELTPARDSYETHTTVHVGLDRKEYGTDWLDYANKKMKEAIKRAYHGEDVDYHFWGHSEEVARLDQWDRFEEFLNNLKDMK